MTPTPVRIPAPYALALEIAANAANQGVDRPTRFTIGRLFRATETQAAVGLLGRYPFTEQ